MYARSSEAEPNSAHLRHTPAVAWLPIRAGQDHLSQFSRKPAIDALAEMIWNGLDAEADRVEVTLETTSLLGDDLEHLTRVVVVDNGHGITPAIAASAFPSLGDSWKRSLNGRTLNDRRALHGQLGRGRFFAYALGDRVRWSSVSDEGGSVRRIEITGDLAQVDGFNIGDPVADPGPVGTTLSIDVGQDRPSGALLREDLAQQLAARFAAHLLGNRDIDLRVNGVRVDPSALIDGEPTEVRIDDLDLQLTEGQDSPVMTIVDWNDDMRRAPGVLLCTIDGMALIEVPRSAPPGTVRSTGYLRWSGWAESGADLLLASLQHPTLVEAATRALAEHVAARTGDIQVTIVATMKREGSYPYPSQVAAGDPIEETERQIFDLAVVSARSALKGSTTAQRRLSAQLLKVALQERPESLDIILSEALALSDSDRDEFAELLRYSSLGAIVGAASEVTRRLDLVSALRHLIYDPKSSNEMREVDQLHPLVRDNAWLFGEQWSLGVSETGLTSVMRAVVADDVVLEHDLLDRGASIRLDDGRRGRVDLMLQRALLAPDRRMHRLVIELKRPSTKIGDAELRQVKSYARALANHPVCGKSKWEFWLVGASIKDEISDELVQSDRAWGHVIKATNYDIHVTHWGQLLDDAGVRLEFYREQLQYSASQEDAVERVRRRHAELLPGETVGEAAIE
jgi:hypothetical protein